MFLTTAPDAWGELETADVPAEGADTAEPEVIPGRVGRRDWPRR